MMWNLERKLNRIGRRANPERGFRLALERRLQQAGAPMSHPWYRLQTWKMALASSGLIVSLGAGTAAYAYTSPQVLPDHPLYPLRTGLESIETQLATTPAAKASVEMKHLKRRMQETRLLQERDPGQRPESVKAVMNQIQDEVEHLPNTGLSQEDVTQVSAIKDEVIVNDQEIKNLAEEQKEFTDEKSQKEMEDILKEDTEQLENSVKALQSVRDYHEGRTTVTRERNHTNDSLPSREDDSKDEELPAGN